MELADTPTVRLGRVISQPDRYSVGAFGSNRSRMAEISLGHSCLSTVRRPTALPLEFSAAALIMAVTDDEALEYASNAALSTLL